jgi:pectin methylesterase-like acyl-CoA thioesterase
LYVTNSYVEGNVDFIWGRGAAYFDHCELKTAARAGYEVQSRNVGPASYGYVFVDSKLTTDPGITNNVLGRIDSTAYPDSNVAYINCEMGPHISPRGWLVTGAPDAGTVRFWEYQSVDPSGQPIDVSMRVAPSRQLSAEEAAMLRDKATVLGGWNPTP